MVATPSPARRGIRQNLFAEGQARITDEPQAVEAVRANPESPLRHTLWHGHMTMTPGDDLEIEQTMMRRSCAALEFDP